MLFCGLGRTKLHRARFQEHTSVDGRVVKTCCFGTAFSFITTVRIVCINSIPMRQNCLEILEASCVLVPASSLCPVMIASLIPNSEEEY